MDNEELQGIATSAPFSYKQSVTETNSQSRWQVDTTDIRLFVEHNLKGERETEVTYNEYNIINSEGKVEGSFWANNDQQAIKKLMDWKVKHTKIGTYEFQKTQNYEYVREWKQVREPLVNSVGSYHLLSFVDPIFSQVGYLSKLTKNEIKDIMWDNVMVTLHTTIMQNHMKYGIQKGSRDEIVSLFDSMCNLVLNAAEEGWTGEKLREASREIISTTDSNNQKRGWFR